MAANDLRGCGWTKEAEKIVEVLNGLPTGPIDGNQPEILKHQRESIRTAAERVKKVLEACIKDAGAILQNATAVETPQESEAIGNDEQVDERQALPGTIGADEIDNYVLFSVVMANHLPDGVFPTDKQLKNFLSLHADKIKQGRPAKPDRTPHKQRFVIHVADWLKQRDDFATWWKARYAIADEPNEQQKADANIRQAAIRETKRKPGSRKQLPGNLPLN